MLSFSIELQLLSQPYLTACLCHLKKMCDIEVGATLFFTKFQKNFIYSIYSAVQTTGQNIFSVDSFHQSQDHFF